MERPDTNWKSDVKAGNVFEQLVTRYVLDGCYNPILREKYPDKVIETESIHFSDDKMAQIHGKDIRWRVGDNVYYIDVKGQGDMINRPTPTFILELAARPRPSVSNGYRTDGRYYPGWFMDKSKLTDYYCFVWPHVCADKPAAALTDDDIYLIDCMLVPKKNLQTYLAENYGLTYDVLAAKANEYVIRARNHKERLEEEIVNNKLTGDHLKYVKTSGVYHGFGVSKQEEPINLVVWKSVYAKVPGTKYFILSRANDISGDIICEMCEFDPQVILSKKRHIEVKRDFACFLKAKVV